MHVYTMGTRAYAEEVCAAIDPGEVFFSVTMILDVKNFGVLKGGLDSRFFACSK